MTLYVTTGKGKIDQVPISHIIIDHVCQWCLIGCQVYPKAVIRGHDWENPGIRPSPGGPQSYRGRSKRTDVHLSVHKEID